MTTLDDFARLYDFTLDEFQRRACASLERGHGVLVAAPTGSGKTVVGEFAIHLALEHGGKCFYTTPIKALSNQKFADLTARYGAGRVGLLTGDNTINGEAPVVVMTTEVLRNMLYAGSGTLSGLQFVVMDEVHYLADRSRGAVWEEVIIHLPESVAVVSLSATVSNAEEFGDWLATVRGSNDIVVEERRPVPLFQHVMVGSRLYDLFSDSDEHLADGSTAVNPRLTQVARDDWRSSRMRDHRTKRGQYRRPTGRALVPSRTDVVERLDAEGLLPAIMFIFSRKGCDAAVQQCLRANLRLTTAAERDEIRAFVEARTSVLPGSDLEVLGYPDWAEALTRGISSHHAGMLPIFKECVEELFSQGPREGRLRDRDAGARHQHAGAVRRDRQAVEVERRDARRHDAGGVHPAHRSGRAPRDRRRGPRRRAVGTGLRPQGGRRAGIHAYLSAALVVSPVLQHGGQSRPPVREGHRQRAAGVVVRPVPGRPRGRRSGPSGPQGRGGARGVRRRHRLRQGRLHGVRGASPGAVGPGGHAVEAPPQRPPRRRDGLTRPAPDRRCDRGARGAVVRAGGGHRPGCAGGARRAETARAHRGAAGEAAVPRGLPDAGRSR